MGKKYDSQIIAAIIGGIFVCMAAVIGKISIPPIPSPEPHGPTEGYGSKSTFAVLVGVTDNTAFSTQAASNYTYMARVNNANEAANELSSVFGPNDLVYVVHVPNLRITPGNPG